MSPTPQELRMYAAHVRAGGRVALLGDAMAEVLELAAQAAEIRDLRDLVARAERVGLECRTIDDANALLDAALDALAGRHRATGRGEKAVAA